MQSFPRPYAVLN